MRFIDLFAGLGGFHLALTGLGHECVFASEKDDDLRRLYKENFYGNKGRKRRGLRADADLIVKDDIRTTKELVPEHDILCAGFPCQPFSKSGLQNGRRDRIRGTLFGEIIEILQRQKHKPEYLILENVGNFERHNRGRTWRLVRESLQQLGYDVRGTEHKASGGHGLISPHHLGYPHTRERFFIVASRHGLPEDPFPLPIRGRATSLDSVVQSDSELSAHDLVETRLSSQQMECIDHWTTLLKRLPKEFEPPSFPIWGDEIGALYPYNKLSPSEYTARQLREILGDDVSLAGIPKRKLLEGLPSYARRPGRKFPDWKIAFIRQNREWFQEIAHYLTPNWIERLRAFPPSLRKLEWNCKGEERDLWQHVLQFRPSGLRVKRYSSVPALVAMTTTQIPILGPKRRFLTEIEGKRLQNFPDDHRLPDKRARAFGALGNAVHVGVTVAVAERLLAGS